MECETHSSSSSSSAGGVVPLANSILLHHARMMREAKSLFYISLEYCATKMNAIVVKSATVVRHIQTSFTENTLIQTTDFGTFNVS